MKKGGGRQNSHEGRLLLVVLAVVVVGILVVVVIPIRGRGLLGWRSMVEVVVLVVGIVVRRGRPVHWRILAGHWRGTVDKGHHLGRARGHHWSGGITLLLAPGALKGPPVDDLPRHPKDGGGRALVGREFEKAEALVRLAPDF